MFLTRARMCALWTARERSCGGAWGYGDSLLNRSSAPELVNCHRNTYYISSAKLDAETFAKAVRAHWGIENRLHWVLDVVFHDDLARLRTGHGPENMAVVKHMAMNLVRNPKDKHSLKNRRKLASLNNDYLEQLIRQKNALT